MDTKTKRTIDNLFKPNKKCIINADLDGLLSGMLLKEFLNWDIVGFSSCCGKPNDELWLRNEDINLSECVFVDLPVCMENFSAIDQHFVAFKSESIEEYTDCENKLNPNILREKTFQSDDGKSHYTNKYPFGTVHFILAMLEYLNLIPLNYRFDFNKSLGTFDVADLILRADRVIGNTFSFTRNCFDWIEWICTIGKDNTNALFSLVKEEYKERKLKEANVESKLTSLGCGGIDGDCSNLLRTKQYSALHEYFEYLATVTNLPSIPSFEFAEYGKLHGTKYYVYHNNQEMLRAESKKEDVFSFAFVSMKVLSMTYIDD